MVAACYAAARSATLPGRTVPLDRLHRVGVAVLAVQLLLPPFGACYLFRIVRAPQCSWRGARARRLYHRARTRPSQ